MSRSSAPIAPVPANPFPTDEETTTTSYRRLLASLPYTVRRKVGRLVELRLLAMRHAGDLVDLRNRVASEAIAAGRQVLICADYRFGMPLPDEVVSAWATEMKALEPLVERSAILLDPINETFNLPFARVAEQGGLPSRRYFTGAPELRAWLREVATEAELSRVDRLVR
jgi:hypothetical protein